jgi:hypothetical protein
MAWYAAKRATLSHAPSAPIPPSALPGWSRGTLSPKNGIAMENLVNRAKKKHGIDNHAIDKHAMDKLAIDKHAMEQHAMDKLAIDKHANDNNLP